jgi:hypothetical protein
MKRYLAALITTIVLFLAGLGIQPSSADGYPPCTATVTEASQSFQGTEGDDVICVSGDKATVIALGGNDIIIATAPGTYYIQGGFGDDIIDMTQATTTFTNGGWGNDTIYGSPGNDGLGGNAGDDIIYGYDGDDEIEDAGGGKNTFYGGNGNDSVKGGDDADSLYGQNGFDTIQGNAGDDVISGGDGDDVAYGDVGNDTIDGGIGVDNLYGGVGNDTIAGGVGDDTLYGDLAGLVVIGGADILRGEAGADKLYGGGGNDTIQGGDDNDQIVGGPGIDIQQGGSGVNTCDFDFGETKDSFCSFPSEDPNYSVFVPKQIEVTNGPVSLALSLDTAEVDGYKDFVFTCGTASSKIDFSTKQVTDSLAEVPNQPLTISERESQLHFYVNLPLTFPKGLKGAEYQCNSTVRDNFGHSFSKKESKISVISTPAGLPSAPVGLSFSWTSPTVGTLSWAQPAFTGTPKFTNYQAQFGYIGDRYADIYNGKTKSTSLVLTKLAPTSTYSYRVRAVNALTTNSLAYMTINWSSINVPSTKTKKIAAPTKVLVSAISSEGAKFSWTKPSGVKNLTNYQVSYSKDGKTWTDVARTPSTAATQLIQGLQGKTQYLIRLSAVSGAETGYETYVALTTI